MQSNIAIGRLTKDVELRSTAKGTQVAIFNIAINNSKDDTTYLEMNAFNKLAENIAKYVEKGNRILVEYIIKNNNYEKDGKMVYGYKFIVKNANFIDFKNNETIQEQEGNPFEEFANEVVLTEEDLPF